MLLKQTLLIVPIILVLPFAGQAVGCSGGSCGAGSTCFNGQCFQFNPSFTFTDDGKPIDLPKADMPNPGKSLPNTDACIFVNKNMMSDESDDNKMFGEPGVAAWNDLRSLTIESRLPVGVPTVGFTDVTEKAAFGYVSAPDFAGNPTRIRESSENFYYRKRGVESGDGPGVVREVDKTKLYPGAAALLHNKGPGVGMSDEGFVVEKVGDRNKTPFYPTMRQNKDTSKVSYIPNNGSSQEVRPIVVNKKDVVSSVKALQDGQTPDTKVNDDCSLTELNKDEADKLQRPQVDASINPQGQGEGGGGEGGGGGDMLSQLMSALQQALSAAQGQNSGANQNQLAAQATPSPVPITNKTNIISQALTAGIPTMLLDGIFQAITSLLNNISQFGLDSEKTVGTTVVR